MGARQECHGSMLAAAITKKSEGYKAVERFWDSSMHVMYCVVSERR